MEPRDHDAPLVADARPRTAAIVGAAVAPLLPPVVGWILAVGLSGPPDYASWPLILVLAGALAVPVVAGLMVRVLGSFRLGLLPVLVAALAGAVYGAWVGGLFTPADPSGPGGIPCVANDVKGVAYAIVAAGAIVIPALLTMWLVGSSGRRRIVLAVVTVPLIVLLVGFALFMGVTNVLSEMGPPGCQVLYLG